MLKLLSVPAVAGLMVTVPVPVGLIVTELLDGLNPTVELASNEVKLPAALVVVPIGVFWRLEAVNNLLKFQLSFAEAYSKVADAPATVKPAPLAAAADGAPSAKVMFRSSTSNVAVFNVTVVPFTIKSPVTVRLFLTVVVPVSAPTVIIVAEPKALTVVAVVFNRLNVV